jgi:hypothetical protein
MASGWEVSITPAERAARVVLGGLGPLIGVVLLASASGALTVILELLLVGRRPRPSGHRRPRDCPLYARLGHVPESLKEKVS